MISILLFFKIISDILGGIKNLPFIGYVLLSMNESYWVNCFECIWSKYGNDSLTIYCMNLFFHRTGVL